MFIKSLCTLALATSCFIVPPILSSAFFFHVLNGKNAPQHLHQNLHYDVSWQSFFFVLVLIWSTICEIYYSFDLWQSNMVNQMFLDTVEVTVQFQVIAQCTDTYSFHQVALFVNLMKALYLILNIKYKIPWKVSQENSWSEKSSQKLHFFVFRNCLLKKASLPQHWSQMFTMQL